MAPEEKTPLLMLTELFLPTKGGTAMSFDDDFRRLGGKEIHVVTADVPGAAEFDRDHRNTVHRLRLKRIAWLKPESLVMYAKLLRTALFVALTVRIRAVFAGRALPEGLVGWAVARMTGRPVFIYAHGEELTGWGRGAKFKVMRFVLRRADALLANSDFTRQTLIDLIGADAGRIELVYPTVDEMRFQPDLGGADLRASIGMAPDHKLILSVGRLMRRKGFDNVIRALPTLHQQGIDTHYAVIGIGEDADYLRDLTSELGLADRVHFLGHVDYDDLPRWYCACDVFAMPNRDIGGDTEGFGLVYLEAASAARPSIAGIAGGTGSAVIDGVTGLRIDAEHPESVASALARLLSDPAEGERLGRNGRARVLENYTHERRVDQLRRLVARGRYPGAGRPNVRANQSPTA